LDEWLFPKPNLTGDWVVTTVTKTSGYMPFIDVTEEFKFEILQKGNDIIGSGEKIKEIHKDGTTITFNPEKRVRLEVSGYLERNYSKGSKVNLNLIEHGERATSTNTFFLTFIDNEHLEGTYLSTVSNCKGTVQLNKTSTKF
jgi:hypothetical protein